MSSLGANNRPKLQRAADGSTCGTAAMLRREACGVELFPSPHDALAAVIAGLRPDLPVAECILLG